jgi:hypothetical protein
VMGVSASPRESSSHIKTSRLAIGVKIDFWLFSIIVCLVQIPPPILKRNTAPVKSLANGNARNIDACNLSPVSCLL